MHGARDAQKPSFLFVPVVKSTMPLASKAVPRMHPATGMMTLVNRSCARHAHTQSVSRTARNTFHSIRARHRSFDETKTKTHHAALLQVHEPLLALEKLRASSSHTAVRSSVSAHDARFARHIVHARVSPRRPRAIPPDTRRARTDPTLSFHARPSRAHPVARAIGRAIDADDDRSFRSHLLRLDDPVAHGQRRSGRSIQCRLGAVEAGTKS